MNFNINFNITSLNQKGHFRILIITKELIIYKREIDLQTWTTSVLLPKGIVGRWKQIRGLGLTHTYYYI